MKLNNINEAVTIVEDELEYYSLESTEHEKKEFAKELFELANNEHGDLSFYFDFDDFEFNFGCLARKSKIPNTMVLSRIKAEDFEEMKEKNKCLEFVDRIMQDVNNTRAWRYYDEKGELYEIE